MRDPNFRFIVHLERADGLVHMGETFDDPIASLRYAVKEIERSQHYCIALVDPPAPGIYEVYMGDNAIPLVRVIGDGAEAITPLDMDDPYLGIGK